jgi:hypothetical protein
MNKTPFPFEKTPKNKNNAGSTLYFLIRAV